MILDENITPEIVKGLNLQDKNILCSDLRRMIIEYVSKNGGHLASNLGTIELIVALHSVFETPKDRFVFDVGHQAYAHKILTGRYREFERIRMKGGISGYPRPSESKHDAFIAGHSGISLSAALGISEAMLLKGETGKVIAIAGDGSFTNGEIYEGLNNVGHHNKNLIVILNDNEMSISKSSGAMAEYFAQLRSTVKYQQTKTVVKSALDKSNIGKDLSSSISGAKRIVKSALIPDNLFENLGFKYYGPIDGHNVEELIEVFEVAKMLDMPCFIHIKTKKGKGFSPAESNAGQHHAIDKAKNKGKSVITFSEVFGRELLFLGNSDDRICAVTAAMKYATGCNYFAKQFKNRFFDVGIAEGHAVTFSAALAAEGFIPVLAIYSTFLQRGIDQLIHDAAIENTHIVLAIDRAGLVGEDGETHQGTFDVPLLMPLPNTTVFSPSNADEMRLCLDTAVFSTPGIVAVRYPRGMCGNADYSPVRTDFNYQGENNKVLAVTYGRLTTNVHRLREFGVDTMQLIQIKPIPTEAVDIIRGYKKVYFVEESAENGSVGENLLLQLSRTGWKGEFHLRGITGFATYCDVDSQLKLFGLDFESLAKFIAGVTIAEEKRLDVMLTDMGIAKSRTVAQELIRNSMISVNGRCVTKSSAKVSAADKIELVGDLPKYVSRGGLKLEKAVRTFNISLDKKLCLDIGASTGGFTDCMLQQGASKVYAVDVGTNQLDQRIKSDERVTAYEQTDVRKLKEKLFSERFQFASVDVSFISLKLVLPYLKEMLAENAEVIALIKPQFEVGKKYLKNGIVHDEKEQLEVVGDIREFVAELGYTVIGVVPTDVKGAEMNREYLIYFKNERFLK